MTLIGYGLWRLKESKHISSRRGENSGKAQRLTWRLDELCDTAICIVLVSSLHNLFSFVCVFVYKYGLQL
jgi:hypothetical protein